MLTGAATMENNVEDPQKRKIDKNRTTLWFSNSSSGHLSEEDKNINSKRCTHMFIAASLTIAKIWKHPTYPLIDKSKIEYY